MTKSPEFLSERKNGTLASVCLAIFAISSLSVETITFSKIPAPSAASIEYTKISFPQKFKNVHQNKYLINFPVHFQNNSQNPHQTNCLDLFSIFWQYPLTILLSYLTDLLCCILLSILMD